ncbi:hypothetical protein [Mucilaginibacter sp. CSA2-8R]|uniref:hypothetical protein n=1 Tax=Mucilaginibacter sp. CSA2-8R TaxID=3141542 RepID=UPI00315D110B
MQNLLQILKQRILYLGICRYILGIIMIPYGLTKIMRTQFVTDPDVWKRPLEELSGINLTWAFLGHSPWFTVLLGCLEFMPALLLLFRRTTLLGAILMLPMTLNVLFINYAYNLWDGTKQMAIFLFVLNCLVLLYERERIVQLLRVIINRTGSIKRIPLALALNAVVIGVVCYFAIKPLIEYRRDTNLLTGNWFNGQPIEWVLQRQMLNDSVLPSHQQKIYFGPLNQYTELGMNHFYSSPNQYVLNAKESSLVLKDADGKIQFKFKYTLLGDTGMKMVTTVGSGKPSQLTQYYSRRVMHSHAEDL